MRKVRNQLNISLMWNKTKSHVRKLINPDGSEETNPKNILANIKSFYSKLYTRRSVKTEKEIFDYLYDLNITKLSHEAMTSCEGKLTVKECWNALDSMGNNKSPGNDGFTKEFYLAFFNDLNQYLVDSLNFSLVNGEFSSSQKQAVITLIEKKDRDKRILKNWRPISLIKVDVKIASKALALRVRSVTHELVHSDQTAYVKDRYIGEPIRIVDDILEYTECNQVPGILFSADFEKAFDSIDHTFILVVLEKYGFGPDFINVVKTLFTGAKSCVMNNGHSTGYFPLERGTRQGDPVSAYFFILPLEILFIRIRQNEQKKGICISDHELKVSAYADDANFLVNDIQSLNCLFLTCTDFGHYSSLRLNEEKSEASWIGSNKSNTSKPLSCKWVNLKNDKIKILGCYSSYCKDLSEKYNFLEVINKLKTCLHVWKSKRLTLAGKILIFKTMALSKILYIATMKAPSKLILDELDVIQKEFIWDSKRPKIKHSILIADYSEGGYKNVDIKSKLMSLKLIWIKRLLDDNFHTWKHLAKNFLMPLGDAYLFHSNLSLSDRCLHALNKLPKFYQELINL